MNELMKKLIFWRIMLCLTALGSVFYIVKYDFDVVFMMMLIVFAMIYCTTQTIKSLLKKQIEVR